MIYLKNIKFFVQSVYKDYPKEFILLIIFLVVEALLTSSAVLSIIPFADYLIDPELNNPNALTIYFLKFFITFDIQPSYLAFATIFILSNSLRAGASLLIKFKLIQLKFKIEKSIAKKTLKQIFQARWTFFNNLEYVKLLTISIDTTLPFFLIKSTFLLIERKRLLNPRHL